MGCVGALKRASNAGPLRYTLINYSPLPFSPSRRTVFTSQRAMTTQKSYGRIGYGCMGLSGIFGDTDREESKATLRRTIELGSTLWDTADIYGNGHNESLVGEVLAEGDNRSKVFLVTKFGFTEGMKLDGSLEYAHKAIDASIRRLGTTPDAWIIHRIPKDVPIEEVVKNMDAIRKQGKTTFIGIGEPSEATLRRACKVAKIDFIESEYSPFELGIEKRGILAACKELGVKVLGFSPLGRGFLTGQFKSISDFEKGEEDHRVKFSPRLAKDLFEKNYRIVAELERIANAKGCTTGQLVLAWELAQSDNIIPIPGTRRGDRVAENIGALNIKFTNAELAELRQVIEANQPEGDRYVPLFQDLLDQ